MSHKQIARAVDRRASTERRASRALMEAGIVVVLTGAIVAVLCLLSLDHASAAPLDEVMVGTDGRLAIGAVLMAVFAGLCVLSSFMLRDTLAPNARRRSAERGRRIG